MHTGPLKILQCDNGKEFVNSDMDRLANEFNITIRHSRPRRPQSNGQIERFNQTLTRYLQRLVFYVDDKDQGSEKNKVWLPHLNKVVYLMNRTENCATKKTPLRLFLGISGFNTITLTKTEETKFSDDKNEEN